MGGKHAVVIGGSIGGCLAAAALARCFERVTVLERDPLDDGAHVRKGVPQSAHVHALLARGYAAVEELLPGVADRVVAAGALQGDATLAPRYVLGKNRIRQVPGPLRALSVTRPLLEREIRRAARELPAVTFRDEHDVEALLSAESGKRIAGVRAVDRKTRRAENVGADVVVDTSGRGSRTPRWLSELGYAAPKEQRLRVDVSYTTCVLERAPEAFRGDLAVIVGGSGECPRGGVAQRIEGGRAIVTLGGYGGTRPPLDVEGIRAYARSLLVPDIAEIFESSSLAAEPRPYRHADNYRRAYEALRAFPEGLVVLGDAICSFNPIYAQGMSVAAAEAVELARCLEAGTERIGLRFFRRAAKIVGEVWQMVVGNDLRIPQVEGPRPLPVRLVNAWIDRVQAAAARDDVVAAAFHRVLNLIDPPPALFEPRIVWRVLRSKTTPDALALPASAAAE